MDLVWLPEARFERRVQLAYIASHDPMAAIMVGDRLRTTVERLTQFPHAGRLGRRHGTREIVVAKSSLIVVYVVDQNAQEIRILGVIHARQKYPLGPSPE